MEKSQISPPFWHFLQVLKWESLKMPTSKAISGKVPNCIYKNEYLGTNTYIFIILREKKTVGKSEVLPPVWHLLHTLSSVTGSGHFKYNEIHDHSLSWLLYDHLVCFWTVDMSYQSDMMTGHVKYMSNIRKMCSASRKGYLAQGTALESSCPINQFSFIEQGHNLFNFYTFQKWVTDSKAEPKSSAGKRLNGNKFGRV